MNYTIDQPRFKWNIPSNRWYITRIFQIWSAPVGYEELAENFWYFHSFLLFLLWYFACVNYTSALYVLSKNSELLPTRPHRTFQELLTEFIKTLYLQMLYLKVPMHCPVLESQILHVLSYS